MRRRVVSDNGCIRSIPGKISYYYLVTLLEKAFQSDKSFLSYLHSRLH